jgi:hypothetical protein
MGGSETLRIGSPVPLCINPVSYLLIVLMGEERVDVGRFFGGFDKVAALRVNV